MEKRSMEELGRMSVEEFRHSEKLPIVVVLENIRSAYNVGSLFRTADAFRLESIFITGYTAHPPHKEINKTALGAQDTVSWKYYKTAAEAIATLREKGYQILAIEQVKDSSMLHQFSFDPHQKIAVVFGNEVSGINQETINNCDGAIEIPQLGMKHSLNIATAAGVVLWEIVRSHLNREEHHLGDY